MVDSPRPTEKESARGGRSVPMQAASSHSAGAGPNLSALDGILFGKVHAEAVAPGDSAACAAEGYPGSGVGKVKTEHTTPIKKEEVEGKGRKTKTEAHVRIPITNPRPKEEILKDWQRLSMHAKVYADAKADMSGAMVVFKFYEKRRDPSTPAPSVRKALDAKKRAVEKAKTKLEEAEMKALQKAENIAAKLAKKAMQQATKDAKAAAKARAKAKGKATKATSPVPEVNDMEVTEIRMSGTDVTSSVRLGALTQEQLVVMYYATAVGIPALSKTEEHCRRIIQDEHLKNGTLRAEHLRALMTTRGQNFLFISNMYKERGLDPEPEGELRYLPAKGLVVDAKGKPLNVSPVEVGKPVEQTMKEAECFMMSDDESDLTDDEFIHPNDM